MPKRILLVDDDRATLRAVSANLSVDGYDISSVSDGDKALELIGENEPHLVILDILMPGLNGVELLDRIRQIDPNLPVIVCSGASDLEPFVRYSSIHSFITKPINFNILRGKVAEILSDPAGV